MWLVLTSGPPGLQNKYRISFSRSCVFLWKNKILYLFWSTPCGLFWHLNLLASRINIGFRFQEVVLFCEENQIVYLFWSTPCGLFWRLDLLASRINIGFRFSQKSTSILEHTMWQPAAPWQPQRSKSLLFLMILTKNRYFFDPRPSPIRSEPQNRYLS